jgi:hypothetical protein
MIVCTNPPAGGGFVHTIIRSLSGSPDCPDLGLGFEA